MLRHRQFSLAVLGGIAALSQACATTHPMPVELSEARRDFEYSATGEATQAAPAELHTAKKTLQQANEAFARDPEDPRVRDLAYVAQRQAAVARAQARIHLTAAQADKAVGEVNGAAAQALQSTQEELRRTKEQLNQAEAERKKAMEALHHIKGGQVRDDARGTIITLAGNVLFQQGKSTLLPAARSTLKDLAKALVGMKADSITIEGYTDNTGTDKRNAQVSQARAEAVLGYFASQGVSSEKMKAVGKGNTNPIAKNTTAEGRATNRRVEIVVQGESKAAPKSEGSESAQAPAQDPAAPATTNAQANTAP
jgi:outer membrane protein OmpA-like peptidoglycan-associated protein